MACITTVHFSVMVNGELHGYFQGKRGLRQGDPMSPYLFTLVMEYLSRLLIIMAREKGFHFHPNCKKLNLTNLCYADDLMIFAKAESTSLVLVKKALEQFGSVTGLIANADKTEIFFGGISNETKVALISEMGFAVGVLPVRYLGVPLTSKNPTVSDFGALIDSLTSRILHWTNRHRTYAGRLILVRAVLTSLTIFWSRIFLFPKKVIKIIDGICRSYLWSGESKSKKAPIAWEQVCKPKSVGGLGLRNSVLNNKAMVISQLWDFVLKKDSLWIKWVNSYYVKDSSIFSVQEKNNSSWVIRKILRAREDAAGMIDVVGGQVSWIIPGKPYTASATYSYLVRTSGNDVKVDWSHLVWNRLSSPKHSFISWLNFHGRLATKDRLQMFGIANDGECLLCDDGLESKRHLFFECSYSMFIVEGIMAFVHAPRCCFSCSDAADMVNDEFAGPSWRNASIKAAINLAVYSIWSERNARAFRMEKKVQEKVLQEAIQKFKVMLVKVKKMKDTRSNRAWAAKMRVCPVFIKKGGTMSLA